VLRFLANRKSSPNVTWFSSCVPQACSKWSLTVQTFADLTPLEYHRSFLCAWYHHHTETCMSGGDMHQCINWLQTWGLHHMRRRNLRHKARHKWSSLLASFRCDSYRCCRLNWCLELLPIDTFSFWALFDMSSSASSSIWHGRRTDSRLLPIKSTLIYIQTYSCQVSFTPSQSQAWYRRSVQLETSTISSMPLESSWNSVDTPVDVHIRGLTLSLVHGANDGLNCHLKRHNSFEQHVVWSLCHQEAV